jgi:hypothetical protein
VAGLSGTAANLRVERPGMQRLLAVVRTESKGACRLGPHGGRARGQAADLLVLLDAGRRAGDLG